MFISKSTIVIAAVSAIPSSVNAAAGVFTYDPDRDDGPVDWPSVDTGDSENQCGGSAQSGIDVPTGPCDETNANYIFEPGTCTLDDLTFVLYPHAVQANYPTEGCTPPRMTIPGVNTPWEALQFHIHTGTDHAIDGTYYGADFHLVHKAVDGDGYAVLGLFLEPTAPDDVNQFGGLLDGWEAVEASVNGQCSATTVDDNTTETTTDTTTDASTTQGVGGRRLQGTFNPYSLVPEQYTVYFYSGSLTTPPCSEVVTWNVVDKPVELSVREYLRLSNLIINYVDPATCEVASTAAPSGFTGRPVQPINGRTITHKCPTGTEQLFAETDNTTPEESSDEIKDDDTSSVRKTTIVAGLAATAAALMI